MKITREQLIEMIMEEAGALSEDASDQLDVKYASTLTPAERDDRDADEDALRDIFKELTGRRPNDSELLVWAWSRNNVDGLVDDSTSMSEWLLNLPDLARQGGRGEFEARSIDIADLNSLERVSLDREKAKDDSERAEDTVYADYDLPGQEPMRGLSENLRVHARRLRSGNDNWDEAEDISVMVMADEFEGALEVDGNIHTEDVRAAVEQAVADQVTGGDLTRIEVEEYEVMSEEKILMTVGQFRKLIREVASVKDVNDHLSDLRALGLSDNQILDGLRDYVYDKEGASEMTLWQDGEEILALPPEDELKAWLAHLRPDEAESDLQALLMNRTAVLDKDYADRHIDNYAIGKIEQLGSKHGSRSHFIRRAIDAKDRSDRSAVDSLIADLDSELVKMSENIKLENRIDKTINKLIK